MPRSKDRQNIVWVILVKHDFSLHCVLFFHVVQKFNFHLQKFLRQSHFRSFCCLFWILKNTEFVAPSEPRGRENTTFLILTCSRYFLSFFWSFRKKSYSWSAKNVFWIFWMSTFFCFLEPVAKLLAFRWASSSSSDSSSGKWTCPWISPEQN